MSVASWAQQTYLYVLGADLGARILEVLKLQQACIAAESTPTAIAPTSPVAETGKDPSLHEVDVPTADTVADQEEFLEQLANNEDASTVQQAEMDPLLALLHTKLDEGGKIIEIIEQLKDQEVQKALAATALKQLIKRKAARKSDDVSTLASHPENGAGKRRIFSMSANDPMSSIPGLGGIIVAPPIASQTKERFRQAARAMSYIHSTQRSIPAPISVAPVRPVVETKWMAMNAHVFLLSSRQIEHLTVSTLSDFHIGASWGESITSHGIP